MKPEFLQNFKVGDTPLPKEAIDAILAENSRDVEAAVKPFADYESIKEQLKTATEGLKAFEGVDVKDLQGQVYALCKGGCDAKDIQFWLRHSDVSTALNIYGHLMDGDMDRMGIVMDKMLFHAGQAG